MDYERKEINVLGKAHGSERPKVALQKSGGRGEQGGKTLKGEENMEGPLID